MKFKAGDVICLRSSKSFIHTVLGIDKNNYTLINTNRTIKEKITGSFIDERFMIYSEPNELLKSIL